MPQVTQIAADFRTFDFSTFRSAAEFISGLCTMIRPVTLYDVRAMSGKSGADAYGKASI